MITDENFNKNHSTKSSNWGNFGVCGKQIQFVTFSFPLHNTTHDATVIDSIWYLTRQNSSLTLDPWFVPNFNNMNLKTFAFHNCNKVRSYNRSLLRINRNANYNELCQLEYTGDRHRKLHETPPSACIIYQDAFKM